MNVVGIWYNINKPELNLIDYLERKTHSEISNESINQSWIGIPGSWISPVCLQLDTEETAWKQSCFRFQALLTNNGGHTEY